MSAPALAPTGTEVRHGGRWGYLWAGGLPTGCGTMEVALIAPGLQLLLGVAPLSTSNGASSRVQERVLGSPSAHMVSSTWKPTLAPHVTSPEVLCLVMRDGALCSLTSPAQQRGMSTQEPLPPQGLLPRRDSGWLVGAGSRQPRALALCCVLAGSLAGWHGARWCCSPSS